MDLEATLRSTVLESLIEKITNVQNKSVNFSAINAFIKILVSEPESAVSAIQLITCKMQSAVEWEAVQTLNLLEACVDCKCECFLVEVGKFRFLNELIKLVSPKYMGNTTPAVIKDKIIDLLKSWSQRYHKEIKIKEAYDMLIKQGVAETFSKCEAQSSLWSNVSFGSNYQAATYEDDEKTKTLQKLLKSNKPDDLKAANLLIKAIVKEKEEKEYLQLIANSVKLLSEMMSSISPETSEADTELIKELKEICISMKPTLAYMISTNSKSTNESAELFELNDLLNDILKQYQQIMMDQKRLKDPLFVASKANTSNEPFTSSTLLDLNSSMDDVPLILPNTVKCGDSAKKNCSPTVKAESCVDTLKDIFDSSFVEPNNDKNYVESEQLKQEPSNSATLFQDLNVLGRSLLPVEPVYSLTNAVTKITLDDLAAKTSHYRSYEQCKSANRDESLLNEDHEDVSETYTKNSTTNSRTKNNLEITFDDIMTSNDVKVSKQIIEPLSDISVPLVDIQIDGNKKLTAFEDPNGITVNIQLTKNKPRNDVSVFLVLTNSKKTDFISNFVFQPVISKECRLKLQPCSKTELSPYNPHIPIDTIVQIMLIASMQQDYIPLKFVISYLIKDEMITEMGEVTCLPLK